MLVFFVSLYFFYRWSIHVQTSTAQIQKNGIVYQFLSGCSIKSSNQNHRNTLSAGKLTAIDVTFNYRFFFSLFSWMNTNKKQHMNCLNIWNGNAKIFECLFCGNGQAHEKYALSLSLTGSSSFSFVCILQISIYLCSNAQANAVLNELKNVTLLFGNECKCT